MALKKTASIEISFYDEPLMGAVVVKTDQQIPKRRRRSMLKREVECVLGVVAVPHIDDHNLTFIPDLSLRDGYLVIMKYIAQAFETVLGWSVVIVDPQ
jgi:hypothetical protein